jgi:isopentenyl-diphosphate Delta-isomerase
VGEAGWPLEMELDPGEVAAVRWVGLEPLRAEIAERPQAFTPWLRIYLERHAKLIFGTSALAQAV